MIGQPIRGDGETRIAPQDSKKPGEMRCWGGKLTRDWGHLPYLTRINREKKRRSLACVGYVKGKRLMDRHGILYGNRSTSLLRKWREKKEVRK